LRSSSASAGPSTGPSTRSTFFQLFGTATAARIEHPPKHVRATFVTTTTLSERGHQFADQLDVAIEENFEFEDYPRIKCNVARRDGERIYHLPFDQRYDDTLVEPGRGEFWAWTYAEAEAAGFRRAWRGAASPRMVQWTLASGGARHSGRDGRKKARRPANSAWTTRLRATAEAHSRPGAAGQRRSTARKRRKSPRQLKVVGSIPTRPI
jgi:hypothetical protein